jgi:hypothetical protein
LPAVTFHCAFGAQVTYATSRLNGLREFCPSSDWLPERGSSAPVEKPIWPVIVSFTRNVALRRARMRSR